MNQPKSSETPLRKAAQAADHRAPAKALPGKAAGCCICLFVFEKEIETNGVEKRARG